MGIECLKPDVPWKYMYISPGGASDYEGGCIADLSTGIY